MHANSSLTAGELASGREAAFANAEQLVTESELLLNAGYHARALFLAQIAGEEIGKACLLGGYTFLLLRGPVNWKRFWKSFRSHSHKLQSLMLTEAVLCPTLTETERQEELASLKDRAKDLESGKQWSLYVDHIEGAFRQPQSLIPAEMARNAVTWAKGRLAMAARIQEVYTIKAPEAWTAEEMAELEASLESIGQSAQSDDPSHSPQG